MVNAAARALGDASQKKMIGESHAEVISIGECMVELARGADGRFALAYGGDTFNTAVYLARCGIDVAYATLVGDDPYSAGIAALAREERIATHLIGTSAGRMPGLYLIETTASGERSFYYWRERAPARELFVSAHGPAVAGAMAEARLVYFSGITLSLYDNAGLAAFHAALANAKSSGARIAMDGNFRPRGWSGDIARARETYERFWRLADLALPTFDDEQALWGDATPDHTIARLAALGIGEIAVKCGAAGALLNAPQSRASTLVPCPEPVTAIDTTAAGDSFNAAYLAARLSDETPERAALRGHRLAGIVIRHRGAIVPRSATDPVTRRDA